MKKVKIYLNFLFLIFCSCQKNDAGGTTTGNPLVSFTMAGSANATTVAGMSRTKRFLLLGEMIKSALALTPPILKDSTNAVINLDEAWVVVKQVEFKSNSTAITGEVDGDSVSFRGPTAVNLIASNTESFGQVRLNSATLRRIKMRLHNVDVLPNNAPIGLLNKSIYWKGSVGGRQFTFATTEGYEYELAGPNGVILTENSNILLSIQIANLFKRMNMTNVTNGAVISQSNRIPTSNPCPMINASAVDIYSCFIDGLKSESNLGRDDGNDGELTGDAAVK